MLPLDVILAGLRPSTYYLFHPWDKEIPQESQRAYKVAFVAISLITGFIAPLLYYIAYYSYQGLVYLYGRVKAYLNEVEEIKSFQNTLFKEIRLTQSLDEKPVNKEWKKIENEDQSFDDFFKKHGKEDHRPLYIQCIGVFSEKDKQIIHLTAQFLKAFHQVEIHLIDKILPIEDLVEATQASLRASYFPRKQFKGRKIPQYNIEIALSSLNTLKETLTLEKDSRLLVFTNEHLYAFDCLNFVFGSALSSNGGVALISNYMFGGSEINYTSCLFRMMKISAHEFGHTYDITHCGTSKCDIGGYANLDELDASPFYYCSKDSAKICLKQGITLKEYYTRLHTYFEDFNTTFKKNFFENERKHLKKKLEILNNHPELYSNS